MNVATMVDPTEAVVAPTQEVVEGLDHWRSLPIAQQPPWPDSAAVQGVFDELMRVPPLVFAGEVDKLRAQLADVAAGKSFVLQGGDCAETFAGATADNIRNRVKTIHYLVESNALPRSNLKDKTLEEAA